MNDMSHLKRLGDAYVRERTAARQLQSLGSELTRLSKTSIFSLQRGVASGPSITQAHRLVRKGSAIVKKFPSLRDAGPWRAGLEEYAEARLLASFVGGDARLFADAIAGDPEIGLGALSDLVGELARLAVREATAGHAAAVERIGRDAERIVGFLTSLDLTGSLRSKGDQARQHLRKIEDVRYDLSRRV